MLRLIHPFLYEAPLGRILGDTSLTRLLLYGGRGLGKTTLLRQLQRSLLPGSGQVEPPKDETPQVTWVDKSTREPTKRIARWCLRPRGVLIVDDFDQLFTPELDDILLNLEDPEDGRFRVVVGSRKPPRVLERAVLQARVNAGKGQATPWDDSRSIPTFTSCRLNPWERGWQDRLEIAHHAAVQRLRQEVRARVAYEHMDDAQALLPSRTAARVWVGLVERVTGGYPGLVDGAFDLYLALLLEELRDRTWLPDTDDLLRQQRKRTRFPDTPRLSDFGLCGEGALALDDGGRTSVVALLEDYLLERPMVHVERSLDNLRHSEPSAFAALLELAEKPDEALVEDGRHRLLLLDTGLVYKDEATRRLRLPEGLIVEAIRAMDPPTSMEEREQTPAEQALVEPEATLHILAVNVTEGPADGEGDVVVETSAGTRLVRLNGRPWQVMAYFWAHRDRHVPAAELPEALGFRTIYSARNAILRLNQALRAEGVEEVLESRKGVGYTVLAARH